MRSVLISLVLLAACAGPSIPEQADTTAGGVGGPGGQAGRGGSASAASGGMSGGGGAGTSGSGTGGSSGTGSTSGSGTGSSSGTAGTSGSGTGGSSGMAGTSGSGGSAGGASGSAGMSGAGSAGASGAAAGAAGQGPLVEQACDFAAVGTDCVRCGGASCIDTHRDPANCGACGHACSSGAACKNGVCGGQTIVSAPTSYTSGVLFEGRLFAWGANGYFQTGRGAASPYWVYAPEEALAFGSGIALAQVAGATLVVDAAGSVRGVGLNAQAQLGLGTSVGPDNCGQLGLACYAAPVQATKVTGVAELRFGDHWCGGAHACGRHADRSISCWGDLGGGCGSVKTVAIPQKVPLPESAGLAVTYAASCSRSCDGSVWCWGKNNRKQLGVDSPDVANVPVQIPGLRLTQIAAGFEHFCGIDEAGDVVCWGNSEAGQSGALADTLPVKILGVSHAVQLALGHYVSCALTDQGAVQCWGGFEYTGVADEPATCAKHACPAALPPAMSSVAELGGGAGTLIVRKKDGSFFAWGRNSDAMIGDGTKSPVTTQTPVAVVGLPPK